MRNIRIEITRVYDLAELLAKENNISSAPASWQGQIRAANVTASLAGVLDLTNDTNDTNDTHHAETFV